MKIRILVTLQLLFFIQFSQASIQDHYCGDFNCYDLLKLDKDSTTDQVRKAYRTLSKKLHPDLARARGQEDTTQVFQRINQAYEVLGNEKLRKTYDKYLQNPDKGNMYHYYNYYQAVYLPQTDPITVIATFICLISLIQYAGRKTMYQRAQNYVFRSERFQKEVRDRFQDSDNKKTREQIIQELKKEVNIGGGWSEPKIQQILAIRIILLPYNLIKYIYDIVRWHYKYTLKKQDYTYEDQFIITKKVLKMNEASWFMLGQEQQEYLVEKQLWIKQNLKEHLDEEKKIQEEEKQKFLNSGRGKRYMRYIKKNK